LILLYYAKATEVKKVEQPKALKRRTNYFFFDLPLTPLQKYNQKKKKKFYLN
jgi:hypothetical protein